MPVALEVQKIFYPLEFFENPIFQGLRWNSFHYFIYFYLFYLKAYGKSTWPSNERQQNANKTPTKRKQNFYFFSGWKIIFL